MDRLVGGATYNTSNTIFVDNDRPPLVAVITYVISLVILTGVPEMTPLDCNVRPEGNTGSEVKTGFDIVTPMNTGVLSEIFTF